MRASPLYIGDGLGASANRKPVPVVSPNSHDRAILHHRYDWSVAVINRVQFENHGPARLGPGNVPAVPCRLIKGVELRFPNWTRFSCSRPSIPAQIWPWLPDSLSLGSPRRRDGFCVRSSPGGLARTYSEHILVYRLSVTRHSQPAIGTTSCWIEVVSGRHGAVDGSSKHVVLST